ncbi:MAG: hypothetical protein ABSH20_00220 [Tepidisphaeraceae bacterium]|jgi:hypothetical protein
MIHPARWLAGLVCLLGLLHTPCCSAQTTRPITPELPALAREPDKTIRLGPQTGIHSFALSLDGKTAYVHAGRKYPGIEELRDELLAVDLKAGKVEREIASPSGLGKEPWSERMLLAPDGKTIMVFYDEGREDSVPIRQINLATGKVVREITVEQFGGHCYGWQPMFSSDSQSVYFSRGEDTQHLVAWNLKQNREIHRLKLPDKILDDHEYVVGLWPQGQFVTMVESSWSKFDGFQVSRWNPANNIRDNTFTAPGVPVACGIEMAPVYATASQLFAVVFDSDWERPYIGVWDLASRRQQRKIAPPNDFRFRRVSTTNDNRLVLAENGNGTIAVYDMATSDWVGRLSLMSQWTYSRQPGLLLSADGHTLLARDATYDRQGRENDEDFLAVFDLSRYYTAPATQPAPVRP